MRAPALRAVLLVLAGAAGALAQGKPHRCEVQAVDTQTKRVSELGNFKTVVAEETMTTRTFRLPSAGLVVTASVWYTDESMASEAGGSSMSLALAVGPKALNNAFRGARNSHAELTLNTFDTARAWMNVKDRGRFRVLTMECRSKFEPESSENRK